MTVRFLADENVDADIVEGLCSREPSIDILDVKTAGLRRLTDPALIEFAAEQNRILITHDRNTMTRHFRDRVAAGGPTAGLFVLSPRQSDIGEIIESLLLVWTASRAEEWRNQIAYLPFR